MSTLMGEHRVEPHLEGDPFPQLAFRRRTGRRLKVNVFSESAFFGMENQGGHTAFLDCADLMARHPDLEVVVNTHDRCDLIHSHSWGPLFWAQGARRWSGRRLFTAHVVPETACGTFPLADRARPIVRGYITLVYNYADVVVSVAPRMTEILAGLGVRRPIRTITNPIRSERFFPSPSLRRQGRMRLGIPDERPVVLGVGQVQPRKGIADFAEVARATPQAQFVWVGGRPFGLASAGLVELSRLMASPPPNLKFAGMFELTEMPALYNAADVLLFPSLQENCPYAPMEAASCGLPVVFRDLPEYRALYATPYLAGKDLPALIEHVQSLLASASERERWALATRRIAGTFQVPAYIAATSALYDEVACAALDGRSLPS